MAVRPSVRMEQLGSHWKDFLKNDTWVFFQKTVEKNQVSLKSDSTNWFFAGRQSVQLKSGPYFNMSNLFTKIYNMLYYTTNLYLQ